jgi:hypothetical protein
MTKWHYRVIEMMDDDHMAGQQLDSVGNDGWEAVGVYVTPKGSGSPRVMVLLKRPRPSERDGGMLKASGHS